MAGIKAQTKFEQEQRIKTSVVPEPAIDFIVQCPIERNIKWYRENSQQGISYEAKFKLRGLPHSVEFDANGNLQDIEIKVPFNSLDINTQNSISESFNNIFSKYKIQKTQIQHTGASDQLLRLMQGENIATTVAYELIVKGRQKQNPQYYEILVNGEGKILKQLPIEFRPADNLDY
jgi:hypothetical protein